MDDCDRCCARSTTRWWHAETKAELRMCDHHSREHGAALTADGFQACTPLPTLTAEPATH